MGLTIEDLKPKDFTINIRGVELTCKPLKLEQTMLIASVGNIFNDVKNASEDDIKKACRAVEKIIPEIIPQLASVELDGGLILEIIPLIMPTVTPSDEEFLQKNGVKTDADPKAEKAG